MDPRKPHNLHYNAYEGSSSTQNIQSYQLQRPRNSIVQGPQDNFRTGYIREKNIAPSTKREVSTIKNINLLYDIRERDFYFKIRKRFNIKPHINNFCKRYLNMEDPIHFEPKLNDTYNEFPRASSYYRNIHNETAPRIEYKDNYGYSPNYQNSGHSQHHQVGNFNDTPYVYNKQHIPANVPPKDVGPFNPLPEKNYNAQGNSLNERAYNGSDKYYLKTKDHILPNSGVKFVEPRHMPHRPESISNAEHHQSRQTISRFSERSISQDTGYENIQLNKSSEQKELFFKPPELTKPLTFKPAKKMIQLPQPQYYLQSFSENKVNKPNRSSSPSWDRIESEQMLYQKSKPNDTQYNSKSRHIITRSTNPAPLALNSNVSNVTNVNNSIEVQTNRSVSKGSNFKEGLSGSTFSKSVSKEISDNETSAESKTSPAVINNPKDLKVRKTGSESNSEKNNEVNDNGRLTNKNKKYKMSPNEETDKRNIESDDSKDVIKQTKNSEIKDDSLKDRYISINSAGFDIETMIKKFEERGVPLNLYRDTNDQVIDWSRLTVPENVWFEAYGEFTCLMLSKHPKLKNKPLVTFSAIIQLKCREHGIHITFSELASLVKSSRSEIGTAYKVISSLSDFKKPAMVICNEEESCLRWCSALNLPAPITQAVVELYADAKRLSIAPARSVNSMGAACIWFVISSYNKAISKYSIKFDKPRLPIIDITIASISDVTGMVSFTVQSGARLLNPVKDEVLSNEKLYKIMDEMGLLYKPEDLPDFGESEHLKVPEDSKVGSSQTSSPKSESQLNPPILPSEH